MKQYSVTLFNKYTGEFDFYERLPVISGTSDGIYGNNEIEAIEYFKRFLKDSGKTDAEINHYEYEAEFMNDVD